MRIRPDISRPTKYDRSRLSGPIFQCLIHYEFTRSAINIERIVAKPLDGKYLSIGSFNLMRPSCIMSAKRIVVNSLVLEPRAKIIFWFTIELFALDILPLLLN